MKRPRRHYLSALEKREVWDRWGRGESLARISEALGRSVPAAGNHIRRAGGFAPRIPKRSEKHLSLGEREEISRMLASGASLHAIAKHVGRSPSTISREVARNGGRELYRATGADGRAYERAARPKACKLQQNARLRRAVAGKLARRWSPQQIAGWLRKRYKDHPSMNISHETIYRSLFIQARGVLKKELRDCLRTGARARQVRTGKPKGGRRGSPIPNPVSIRERPAEVEDRAVPGHWEGDLLTGTQGNYIATLVERMSRFTLLVRVTSRADVIPALIKQVQKLPTELRRSLTWDRGREFFWHERFSMASDMKVYFADPQSPWQRGSNENTNGLLRQYFPKSRSVAGYTQAQLNKVARELNGRPRKTLGFQTPAEALAAALP